MPLWGTYDNAANSDIGALMQVNASAGNTAARTLLFNNTTANTSVKSAKGAGNVVVGQFGVSSAEIQAANQNRTGHPQHSGWVLRHEGRGLKAGRVWYETLVAMNTITSDANNGEDTYLPDYALVISTQPTSNSSATAGNLNFTVVTSSVPSGATITYQWQKNDNGWVNVAYNAGQYFNPTAATLTANNITANGNVFRVMVMTAGANTVYSANATIAKV